MYIYKGFFFTTASGLFVFSEIFGGTGGKSGRLGETKVIRFAFFSSERVTLNSS